NADGTFPPRPGLTVTGLGTITGLSSADVDGDGELDIAVSGTDRAAWLKNAHDPAPQPALVNGDFSQGLTGWTRTSGTVSAGGGYAEFREDKAALLSTIRQTFTVPAGAQHLTFDLAAYGIEDPAGGLPDAFEAALLGADNRPLVPAFRPGASSFVNLGPNHTIGLGSGASFDGTTVTLDLAGVAAGTPATLVFDLAGSPPGTASVVGVDNVALEPSVQFDDHFTAVPLVGPFAAAGGVAAADVDGDGNTDVVIADGDKAVLFNGTGGGSLTRTEYPTTAWGTGLSAVAAGPMTAGDTTADAALGLAA